MTARTTTRRRFFGASGAFLLALDACSSNPPRLRSISALGDSMSDTVFNPHAYPYWLPRYFPGTRVFSQGESGDGTAAVLARCRPRGIVDYTELARYLGRPLHPVEPGQYCSVLAGINDVIFDRDSSERIIANLSRIYAYLRRHRSTPFPVTILPWGRSQQFRLQREAVRVAVNRWIVRQPLATDVERLMGDGKRPPALKASFDGGDGLHPVSEGPRVLAHAIASTMRRQLRA